MKVELIDQMGSDLTVVNAARVSFAKESDWEDYCCMCGEMASQHGPYTDPPHYAVSIDDGRTGVLGDRDKKLIRYLARHKHWTPFGHPQVTLHIKVPIFVARQLHKHQVGFVVNEVSRRYVDEEPEFYAPEFWRGRAEDKKQGSSGELNEMHQHTLESELERFYNNAFHLYEHMIKSLGVAPEQARMVLPLSCFTEFYMTGSLAAWSRLYNLRIQPDAQKEVREVAEQIGSIIAPLFPVSWNALNGVHE